MYIHNVVKNYFYMEKYFPYLKGNGQQIYKE